MQKQAKKIFLTIGLSLLFIFIIILAYYRFAPYLRGPELVSINITDYESTQIPWKKLRIETKNTKSVQVNGENIPIEEHSLSYDIVVFQKNENIIKVNLTDSFNKERTYIYHIYLKEEEISDIPKTLKEAQERTKQIEINQKNNTLLENKQK